MEQTSVFTLQTYLIGILVGLGTWFLFEGVVELKAGLLLTAVSVVASINILNGFVREEVIKYKRR